MIISEKNKKKKYQLLLIFQTRDPSHQIGSIIHENIMKPIPRK
jgi:ATP sulfurylase